MPFKSKAQQRWAHTPAGEEALGGPDKVAEWDAATKAGPGFATLPERKGKLISPRSLRGGRVEKTHG